MLSAKVTDLETELLSYAHTGKLAIQLDMVVSVCTSVLHLAAGLGVPCVALLSPYADWRWMDDQNYSTWYPNTKVLRQSRSGDWDELMTRCAQYLDTQFD